MPCAQWMRMRMCWWAANGASSSGTCSLFAGGIRICARSPNTLTTCVTPSRSSRSARRSPIARCVVMCEREGGVEACRGGARLSFGSLRGTQRYYKLGSSVLSVSSLFEHFVRRRSCSNCESALAGHAFQCV
ncbi:hypothetical protein C8R47DRAFT_1128054 [Mycena vitilis]|nr:hypothetical protein C8R47DRAFT_1128054 [Mycena vitilis]